MYYHKTYILFHHLFCPHFLYHRTKHFHEFPGKFCHIKPCTARIPSRDWESSGGVSSGRGTNLLFFPPIAVLTPSLSDCCGNSRSFYSIIKRLVSSPQLLIIICICKHIKGLSRTKASPFNSGAVQSLSRAQLLATVVHPSPKSSCKRNPNKKYPGRFAKHANILKVQDSHVSTSGCSHFFLRSPLKGQNRNINT